MEKTFRIELANSATEWSDVLEQRLLDRVTARLSTPRRWAIEEVVEADRAGWVGSAAEGDTRYQLSLTVPTRTGASPPPPVIEWKLFAGAFRDDGGRLGLPLGAIMLGTGALFGALAWHLRLSAALILLAPFLGIFPVGLVLGIVALRPLAARRSRAPIRGGGAFLREVSAAVEELRQGP